MPNNVAEVATKSTYAKPTQDLLSGNKQTAESGEERIWFMNANKIRTIEPDEPKKTAIGVGHIIFGTPTESHQPNT